MDTLTFLSSLHCLASKIWRPGPDGKPECSAYNTDSGPFTVHRAPVASLPELLSVLTACPATAFHLRDKPIGDQKTIPYRLARPHVDRPANLEEEAHRVIPVDWDGKDAAPMRDLEAAARAVRAQLPAPFSAAECVANATSGAGVKPGMRVRLWFYADRIVSNAELKSAFSGVGCVDVSIYDRNKPIYVAAPRFQGLPDPVPARWCLLEGEPLVLPPAGSAQSVDQLESAQAASRALQGLGAANIPGQVFQSGGRNQAMMSLAGSMRARGMDAEAIYAGLSAHNRTHCNPPLPEDEIGNLARSAANYEPSAVPVVAKVSSVQAEKALRKQLDRLKHDPGLLSDAAAHLKQHILDGTLTETEIQSRISKATKEVHTPVVIIDALRAAPVLASTRSQAAWMTDMRQNAEGGFTPGPINLREVLRHDSIALAYDTRAEKPIWLRCPFGVVPRFYHPDEDNFAIRLWIEETINWVNTPRDPHEAVVHIAHDRKFDPFATWLESLRWDGMHRLGAAATTLLGADTDVERTTFAWWLISAVARTFTPGCQVDHVIVLEGQQGVGKTSFLRQLVPETRYYDRLASSGDLNNPRIVGKLQGPVIIELAEMAALSKRAVESTKEFLDATVDVWQPLYTKAPKPSPRKIVFAGTTNTDDYLNDPTGARRFWPIRVTDIHLDRLAEQRDQLWAEAVAFYRAGAKWYPTREQAEQLGLQERAAERRAAEYADEHVEAFLKHVFDGKMPEGALGTYPQPWQLEGTQLVALTLLWLGKCLDVDIKENAQRLGRSLRVLGWERRRERAPGQQRWVWRRK